ncbi:MAG: hypothetical protein V2G33_06475 [bacterium JZ-2024 1]
MRGKWKIFIILVMCGINLEPLSRALGLIGLTEADFRINPLDLAVFGGDTGKRPFFDVLIFQPIQALNYVPFLGRTYIKDARSAGWLTLHSASRLNFGVRRNLLENPVVGLKKKLAPDYPITSALKSHADLWDKTGRHRAKWKKAESEIPESLRVPLALLILAVEDALDFRRQALASLPPSVQRKLCSLIPPYLREEIPPEQMRKTESEAEKIDYRLLYAGAIDLGFTLDEVLPALSSLEMPSSLFVEIPTSLGSLIVSAGRDDIYEREDALLILDFTGDDVYTRGGGAEGERLPVSLIVDVSGNDRYEQKGYFSIGGACLGYAGVFDLSGEDRYSGSFVSQGAGVFGVGWLMDFSGHDSYKADSFSQGSGTFGIGILSDLEGDDVYEAFQAIQGYGGVLGSGLLLDGEGNDRYIANDEDIRYPSPQSKEHNANLAQGMGMGKRSDYIDGHSRAGGVGILVDGKGNDEYSCGVFGQGTSYWYSIGILYDGEGNDTYKGIWYVQGSTAHFGFGMLVDGEGNDRYEAKMNMAQGAGHDLGIGILHDYSGDDTHIAPNLSLGAGNANGIGLFIDSSGSDSYQVSSHISLGRASGVKDSLRQWMRTLGIFLDLGGGEDTYSGHPEARNEGFWKLPGANELPSELGIGLDE